MRFKHAARTRLVAFTFGLVGIGMAGCGTVDDALFGSRSAAPAAAPAPQPAPAPEAAAAPDTSVTTSSEAAPAPAPSGEAAPALAPIDAGSDTGSPVGKTVQGLRDQLSILHDKAASDLQQLGSLKSVAAQSVTTYQEAKSHIVIRLQAGTTKANPELVGEWNTAQSALDALGGNINALAALAGALTEEAGRAHTERNTIGGTAKMAGAVEDDRRQIAMLQQEADEIVGTLDRAQADAARAIQRQTAFAADERGSLTRLATDIRNGELYATSAMGTVATAPLNPPAIAGESSNAIATIRFDRPKVDFEQDLYTALNQALQAKPDASFRVVAISPTRGSAAAMQKAQSEAQHRAREVLKSMGGMGVPASRVSVASSTDPAAASVEVRVYVK